MGSHGNLVGDTLKSFQLVSDLGELKSRANKVTEKKKITRVLLDDPATHTSPVICKFKHQATATGPND